MLKPHNQQILDGRKPLASDNYAHDHIHRCSHDAKGKQGCHMVFTEKSQTITRKKPGKSQTIFCPKTPIFQRFLSKVTILEQIMVIWEKNVRFLQILKLITKECDH